MQCNYNRGVLFLCLPLALFKCTYFPFWLRQELKELQCASICLCVQSTKDLHLLRTATQNEKKNLSSNLLADFRLPASLVRAGAENIRLSDSYFCTM